MDYIRGSKFFELSNHLGNVLVTISDRKTPVDAGTYTYSSTTQTYTYINATLDGNIDYYSAEVITANDYYVFGMTMPGRKYSIGNSSYRYGYNGKELDKEVAGTTTYDYGFRIYSPGLGRFLSVDPLTDKFAWLSPYQFAGNSPVALIDLDGLEQALPAVDNKKIGQVVNIYLAPTSMFNPMGGNLAMIPGYFQAKAQENAGQNIVALKVANSVDAYNQVFHLKNAGYIIGSLIIDSHGHGGKSFSIGDEAIGVSEIGCTPMLKPLTDMGTAEIVLLGCQVGSNIPLISSLSKLANQDVMANESWTTCWPGMFNDSKTAKQGTRDAIGWLIDNVPAVKGYVQSEAVKKEGWAAYLATNSMLADGATDVIMEEMKPYFKDGISPSGTIDALFDPYYDPAKRDIAKLNSKIGSWVMASTSSNNSVVSIVGNFGFNKNGSPGQDASTTFAQTKLGQDYFKAYNYMQGLFKAINAAVSQTTQSP